VRDGEVVGKMVQVVGEDASLVVEEKGGRAEPVIPLKGVTNVGGRNTKKEPPVKHKPVNGNTMVQQQGPARLIPKYSSELEDRKWATSGMVATAVGEDSTVALQQKVEDAGFNHVVVTPMGGDRVFLHCNDGEDIWQVFNNALHFFGMLFSNIHMWSVEDVKYERGAWLRVYGVPVHAWNDAFLKLIVMDVGRFVKADECTVDKARLDFARVLISTPQLEILNTTSDVLIDGSLYSIKMVEEWGCNLGEDAFLTEVDYEPRPETLINNVDGMEEVQGEWELDDLVNDLHKEWSAHEGRKEGNHCDKEDVEACNITKGVITDSCKKQKQVASTVLEPVHVTNGEIAKAEHAVVKQYGSTVQFQPKGPWSLEWLPNKSITGGNNVTSSKVISAEAEGKLKHSDNFVPILPYQHNKMKVPKKFMHNAGFVKRIARMPSGDRKEIVKFLKQRERKRKARKSSSIHKSANNPSSQSS
jgi:hypothetical protein